MTRLKGSARRTSLRRSLAIAALIAVFAATTIPAGGSTPRSSDTNLSARTMRRHSDVKLSSGELRRAVGRMKEGRKPGNRLHVSDGRILVEVLFSGSTRVAKQRVRHAGGRITGVVKGSLIEARVPFDKLEGLEHSSGIVAIRPPLRANVVEGTQAARRAPVSGAKDHSLAALIGEEIVKTNADDWHAAGQTGAGVKVGIIDYFDDTIWNASQAAGEVIAPAGMFCRVNGTNCNIWTGGSPHGTGVAEIIHEMAPGAQIYIVTVETTTDLQAAVNYLQGQGVDIITRSLTSAYDGPGDGTGPMANVVNSAVAAGITWFNSAGNSAGAGARIGSYWRGSWSDPDGDGWLNFSGTDELMGFGCTFINGLRWNDWGAGKTDYDIYVYDDPAGTVELARSVDDQGTSALPLEHVGYQCKQNDADFLAVSLYNAGSGTAGDVLEFMVNGAGVEYWSNPFSGAAPASDSNSPGALSIGAVDPAVGTAIAPYSSQGPTNDNRIKPDLSAAACVQSLAYAPDCFNGTSAATPVAAGAAALVLGAGAATTPAQLKTYMKAAVVDRGAAGQDNVFGTGELLLPAPTGGGTDTTPPTISSVGDRPDPFTPTARKKKASKIYWTIGEDVPYLFVGIYNGTTLVRTLVESDLAAGGWFTKWNGRNALGRLARRGTYTYVIYAEDLAGNGAQTGGTTTLIR